MAWIVLLKDKESTYGTTWEVYMKNLECCKCSKHLWKQSKFCKQKDTQCIQYLKHLHNPCEKDIFARYVLQK